ncbi:MAG TPA: pirin family protein [Puia sp.]|nr:pirin family protein [Puia sp.]
MKAIFYPASERGHADFGWLNSYHSFSFGNWHSPDKVHFGALRVLNDDVVKGGSGFDLHPHENMEIISIPLKGAIAHKDSTGTEGIIYSGDVQIMSAGSGIRHSEYNASHYDPVNFLQIWVFPKQQNIPPRHDQKTFDRTLRQGKWQVVVSPDVKEGGVWINQDSRFALTRLQAGKEISFTPAFPGNGVYIFVIEGEVTIDGHKLDRRDAVGISDADSFSIQAGPDSELLAIEVPMFA